MNSDQPNIGCRTPDERLQDLFDEASKMPFLPGLNIQQYFRLMRNMLSTIEQYDEANKKEMAYKLSSRFAILFLEHVPKLAGYAAVDVNEKAQWKSRCRHVLTGAERLKRVLRKEYELEYSEYLEEENERQRKLAEAEEVQAAICIRDETEKKTRLEREKRDKVMGTLVPKSTDKRIPDVPHTALPDFPLPPIGKMFLRIPGTPAPSISTVAPSVDRSLKPEFPLSNAYGWSNVRISPNLAERFLQMAIVNTTNNMETCGNLCGRYYGTEFRITDLVLPKQSGTSDSCTTYKEEELFEYTEKHGLIVLGWIHTHPSQTAFLSSVDQHCQLSYQIMLPEAIAIVCSPKFNEIKTFSLTHSYGIDYIRQCNKTGFHPHTESKPIYEQSTHVLYDLNLPFNVVDLR